ncbi:MAG: glycosyltransferase [Chloroflexi bacterium]|nr:MAG: glycosyltransferase [Chloroflexota bacterium]
MRIVHINYLDHYGGAAIAARRLHQAMRRAGHDSRMLVWSKYTDDPNIDLFERRAFWRGLSQLVGKRLDAWGLQYLFHPASMRLPEHPWLKEADVVNLHQFHGGYLDLNLLPRLARTRPLVWTMHDLWAATGHCAIAAYYRCDRWQTGCGRCPDLRAYPAVRRDLTGRMWRLKQRIYARTPMAVVTPSRWLATRYEQSPLFDSVPVHHIANGVDIHRFRPIPKASAREALGLPYDKRILMFGAASLAEPDKGAALLADALTSLPSLVRDDLCILLLGTRQERLQASLQALDVRTLGPVQNEALLAIAYAAADLFVLPSLAENLPNMLIESLACGTPCVAFDVGGCREIIEHGRTGYLARPGDATDLAHGIATLLQDDNGRANMAQMGLAKVREQYDVDRQAHEYLLLYERRLGQRN